MLRKLGSYPRQNRLAVVLREPSRFDRSLLVGLNKGKTCNALARAVFFHRLGEIRDRGFE